MLLSCGAAPAAVRFVFFVGARGGLVVALRFCFLGALCGVAGARAWLSRCVCFLGARRGRAARVLGCCAAFFFLVRAAGVLCACLVVALRFFSWCAPGACVARAWLLLCVFYCACCGRAARVRCVCVVFFFCWCASRAVCVCCFGDAFFFLACVAGGRCACAASAVRFFSGARRWRAVRVRCFGGAFFYWRASRAVRAGCRGVAFFWCASLAVLAPGFGAAFFFLGWAFCSVRGRCLCACFFGCFRLGRAFSSASAARWASPDPKTTGDRSPCASRIKFFLKIFFARACAHDVFYTRARVCAREFFLLRGSYVFLSIGFLRPCHGVAVGRARSPGSSPDATFFSKNWVVL